jgi:hypothetical protein
VLIGISGATGLVSIAMDNAKREGTAHPDLKALDEERSQLTRKLKAKKTGLLAQRAAVVAGTAEAQALDDEIQKTRARLTEIEPLLPPPSQGWWRDLLSDDNGVSLHRLQIAVWTIVFVGVFVVAVWRAFAMPDFDATTLGLMGISSGLYLGFKFPEKTT